MIKIQENGRRRICHSLYYLYIHANLIFKDNFLSFHKLSNSSSTRFVFTSFSCFGWVFTLLITFTSFTTWYNWILLHELLAAAPLASRSIRPLNMYNFFHVYNYSNIFYKWMNTYTLNDWAILVFWANQHFILC